jgi:hypothetical protein
MTSFAAAGRCLSHKDTNETVTAIDNQGLLFTWLVCTDIEITDVMMNQLKNWGRARRAQCILTNLNGPSEGEQERKTLSSELKAAKDLIEEQSKDAATQGRELMMALNKQETFAHSCHLLKRQLETMGSRYIRTEKDLNTAFSQELLKQQARVEEMVAATKFKQAATASAHEKEIARIHDEYSHHARERLETLHLLDLRIAAAEMQINHHARKSPPIACHRPDTTHPRAGEEIDGFLVT